MFGKFSSPLSLPPSNFIPTPPPPPPIISFKNFSKSQNQKSQIFCMEIAKKKKNETKTKKIRTRLFSFRFAFAFIMYLVSIILVLYYIGNETKIESIFTPLPHELFQPPLLLVFGEISNPLPPPPIIPNPPIIRYSRVEENAVKFCYN